MTRKTAFLPSITPDVRLLILGSLPGERSLAQGQYYAHPSNAFWWLMGEITGDPLPLLSYDERLARLSAHRIGLWDVIASATRQGSLDTAIRDAINRDLASFAATLPALAAIAFNGAQAARRGRRQLTGTDTPVLIDLPSSSAAYAGMPRAAKRDRWMALKHWVS